MTRPPAGWGSLYWSFHPAIATRGDEPLRPVDSTDGDAVVNRQPPLVRPQGCRIGHERRGRTGYVLPDELELHDVPPNPGRTLPPMKSA